MYSTKYKNISKYPSWIASDFAENIKINELLHEENKNISMRHPGAYYALREANWNSDDELYDSPLTLPEIRDPFLDTRVVELLFSFPSLPWFFKKHILRSSMKDSLPELILKRPKTHLGYLSYAYLKQPQHDWVDTYSFCKETLRYIKPENIMPLARGVSGASISDTNLKPFYLNEWIKNIVTLSK